MPISLRLPTDVEAQIAGYGLRTGLTKSAVIVRSIQEFLARHAEPSSFQIYQEVMEGTDLAGAAEEGPGTVALAQSPHKGQFSEAIRNKHAERSQRASRALANRSGQPK